MEKFYIFVLATLVLLWAVLLNMCVAYIFGNLLYIALPQISVLSWSIIVFVFMMIRK